jgi:RNA polymerase sigma factor (sigma-70 family)
MPGGASYEARQMNVKVSYQAAKVPEVERELNQQVEKLARRLQLFRPDLVSLHVNIAPQSTREDILVSANLRLPSGQMAAQETAPTAIPALKKVFSELISQLGRHKEQLRGNRKLHRRRSGTPEPLAAVPFEETLAAVHLPTVKEADIEQYVNANLPRLYRFVDRELRYREAIGQIPPERVTREEVIDEVIVSALSDGDERPEVLSLERWLYRLAIRAIRELAANNGEAIDAVPLEVSVRRQNVRGTDDSLLQYHQPDEMMHEEDIVADTRTSTPEDIAANDEMIGLVEAALLQARPEERECFILLAVEGFTVHEIAAATNRSDEQVRVAVRGAREHLKRALPVKNPFKERLLQHSKIA